MPRYAWGIDIGDGTLKAVRLRRNVRTYEITQVIEIPYLDPFLKKKKPPCILDRRAIAALYQFGNTVKIKDQDFVTVGFPSFHAFEGVIEVPRVEAEQRVQMIEYEVSTRINLPLQDLMITSRSHRLKSSDMEMNLVHAVDKEEFSLFRRYLEEARIPFDRIVSSPGALVEIARLSVSLTTDYLIVSSGYNTTDLVILRSSDYWARTLPVGLPLAPGDALEVARDKAVEVSNLLKTAIQTIVKGLFPDQSFKPSKVLVSGEGVRIPAFVNALDAALDAPVEVLRPATRFSISSRVNGLPPEESACSMGKAIGLAKGMLDSANTVCRLAGPSPGRASLRKLPLLTYLCGLVLLLVLGMAGLEIYRSYRLDGHEKNLKAMEPTQSLGELEAYRNRVEGLRKDLGALDQALEDRRLLLKAGKLLDRYEMESSLGTFGDFHLIDLELTFNDGKRIAAEVATRRGSGVEVKEELLAMFKSAGILHPVLAGPFSAEEETPPEGLAPLALFKVEGALR